MVSLAVGMVELSWLTVMSVYCRLLSVRRHRVQMYTRRISPSIITRLRWTLGLY
jgi:hypothetical protein